MLNFIPLLDLSESPLDRQHTSKRFWGLIRTLPTSTVVEPCFFWGGGMVQPWLTMVKRYGQACLTVVYHFIMVEPYPKTMLNHSFWYGSTIWSTMVNMVNHDHGWPYCFTTVNHIVETYPKHMVQPWFNRGIFGRVGNEKDMVKRVKGKAVYSC